MTVIRINRQFTLDVASLLTKKDHFLEILLLSVEKSKLEAACLILEILSFLFNSVGKFTFNTM